MTPDTEQLESRWARLGVLFNCAPAPTTPDLERLLLTSATSLGGNARLPGLVATWLVEFGSFVARHRLRRLAAELPGEGRAALGLLIESALEQGAAAELRIVLDACRAASPARPLFDVHRGRADLETLALRTASPLSIRWGLWSPAFELRPEAIRPAGWLVEHNPSYRDRIVRKGDLRCSILEALRHDAGGTARSESALAQLSGATRSAIRKALESLVLEGEVTIAKRPGNRRDLGVALRNAA